MSKVIMTAKQLVDRLCALESRPNYYKNNYPSNLCYVHKDGRTSADCVNLYKALLNGYDVDNTTVGYYQRDLSNTGDVDGWTLLNQCSDVSQDFTKLKDGEPRLLYMVHGKDWHVGGFIGEVQKYGKIYNVIEATGAWGGHILYSYVDSKGNRYKSKGGEQRKAWTHHGLMTPWVSYEQKFDEIPDEPMKPVEPKPEPTKPIKPLPNTHEGSTVAHYFDQKYNKSYKSIAKDGLNLRSGIGTSTISKGVLPYGSMVNCYGYYDYDNSGRIWLYVSTKFGSGFCCKDYLQ